MTNQTVFSDTHLPDLGLGAGVTVLGFRACAFGHQECRCVRAMYEGAMDTDALSALGAMMVVTRALAGEGTRKIQLSSPGCGRMTRHEVSVVAAFSALQAQDAAAARAHLGVLLGKVPSEALIDRMGYIADTLAGHGHAILAPDPGRRIPGARTPAFALEIC